MTHQNHNNRVWLNAPGQSGFPSSLRASEAMKHAITFHASKQVQDRYNLSVPSVFFSDLASPTVPHNQRDTPIHVAS
jgi:hypothetical protein